MPALQPPERVVSRPPAGGGCRPTFWAMAVPLPFSRIPPTEHTAGASPTCRSPVPCRAHERHRAPSSQRLQCAGPMRRRQLRAARRCRSTWSERWPGCRPCFRPRPDAGGGGDGGSLSFTVRSACSSVLAPGSRASNGASDFGGTEPQSSEERSLRVRSKIVGCSLR